MKSLLICLVLIANSAFSQDIKRYETFSNHWNTEGFLTQFGRAIDSNGVVTQKGKHHPLILCFYGIINYDEFLESGDSIFYHRVLDQYKYFKNPKAFVKLDSSESLGLAYYTSYNGITAPWSSGMTQGVGVSFLLRYYELTKNTEALEFAQKLMRLMLKDEKDGGTMGRTAENLPWIEEYPKSKSSKSVLNGFINGLIGLKEYVDYFPNHIEAKVIHDSCYYSLIESVALYDKPDWTSYNRNGLSLSKAYLRYQISEFDHLFGLYGDTLIRNQMMIWSKFAINHLDKEIKFYKHPDYNYAVGLQKKDSIFKYSDPQNFENGLVPRAHSIESKFFSKKNELKFDASHHYIKLELDSANLKNIECFDGEKRCDCKIDFASDRLILQSEKPFNAIKIKAKKKDLRNISALVYDAKKYAQPLFGIIKLLETHTLQKGEIYNIQHKGSNLINAKVFYRCTTIGGVVGKKNFKAFNYFNLNSEQFIPDLEGDYQFFIGYDLLFPNSSLTEFKIHLKGS